MKLSIILAFFLLSLPIASAEVMISEIMYDPLGSDSKKEWIEIYNNESQVKNITNWKFEENNIKHSITNTSNGARGGLELSGGEYAIIADDPTTFLVSYPNYTGKVFDSSYSLSNSGESLTLIDEQGTTEYTTNYTDIAAQGRSIEIINGSLVQGPVNGTPGTISAQQPALQTISLIINEFLPNPLGDDDASMPGGEWVEIYNPSTTPLDITGYALLDQDDTHELIISNTNTQTTTIQAQDYLVVYRNGDTDFALNNNGFDKVRLFTCYPVSTCSLIDELSYSGSNEQSSWSKIGGNWRKTLPTPGQLNSAPIGECDWEIEVRPNASVLQDPTDIEWGVHLRRIQGDAAKVSVEGKVEDVFGKVLKTYKPWTDESVATSRSTSYTPNLNTKDIYNVIFTITSLNCNDTQTSNNQDSELLVVNPAHKKIDSSVSIEHIYLGSDNKARWGDQIRVKVNLYRGDTGRYAAYLHLNRGNDVLSKKVLTNVNDKFSTSIVTLPLQIPGNCDEKFKDGDYDVVVKGFEQEVREEIEIEDIASGVCAQTGGAKSKKGKFSFEVLHPPNLLSPGEQTSLSIQLNNDQESREVDVWAYAYRGSQSLSGDREENRKKVTLKAGEEKTVHVLLSLEEDTKSGPANIKAVVKRSDRKTSQHSITPIRISNSNRAIIKSINFTKRLEEGEAQLSALIVADKEQEIMLSAFSLLGKNEQEVLAKPSGTLINLSIPVFSDRDSDILFKLEDESLQDVAKIVLSTDNTIQTKTQGVSLAALRTDESVTTTQISPSQKVRQLREGAVVFVSTTYRTKALALPLLFVVCGLVCLMVWFRKI